MPARRRIQDKPVPLPWKYLILTLLALAWTLAYSYDTKLLEAQREQFRKDLANRATQPVQTLPPVIIRPIKPRCIPPTASALPDFLNTGPTKTSVAPSPVKRTRTVVPVEEFTWERDGTPLVPPPKIPVPLEVRLFNFYVFQNLPPPPPPPDTCTDDDFPGVEPIHWTEEVKGIVKVDYMLTLERHGFRLEMMSPVKAFVVSSLVRLYLAILVMLRLVDYSLYAVLSTVSIRFVTGCVVSWLIGCIIRSEVYLAQRMAWMRKVVEELEKEARRRRAEREAQEWEYPG